MVSYIKKQMDENGLFSKYTIQSLLDELDTIEYYLEKLHLDMSMDTLFDDWAIFRRDETSAKPGTVRKDVSLWRTHMR